MQTRVLVVDGQHVVREGVVCLLRSLETIELALGVASAQAALERLESASFDLVLLDRHLEGALQGFDLLKEIHDRWPQLPILVLSLDHRRPSVEAAIASGALGYVSKRSSVAELVAGIEAVRDGRHYLSQAIADGAPQDQADAAGTALRRLSRREREVLLLIARGRTTKEVAVELGISPKTVEKHRAKLARKLAARSIADLTRFAIESGLA